MLTPTGAAQAVAIDAPRRREFVRLGRALFPHPGLADAPYERAVDALLAEADEAGLAAGLAELRDRAAAPLLGLSDDVWQELLTSVETTPFFRLVRDGIAAALYDDREVWAHVGYPGAAFELGGYLHRGFDDLDWLPAVRVEENPHPLPEIGPLP